MGDNIFNKICDTITTLVAKLGKNYNIIQLEETIDGINAKSIIVEVNMQNYLQVNSTIYPSYFESFPKTNYQRAIYHCYPDKDYNYSLHKKEMTVIDKEHFSVENLMHEVFGDIEDKFIKKTEVAELLGDLMEHCVLPDDIGYDINDKAFHFNNWNEKSCEEYLFFSRHFRALQKPFKGPYFTSIGHIAKYTSLDTALLMLNSGKIRMMSVTAMNDKMEIGHLYGKLCDEEYAYLENKTKMYLARNRYITSFSNSIDDLTMWRLYGDNGKGVCLIFSAPQECQYYFPIDYLGEKSPICQKVKNICKEMEKHGFSFVFKSLEDVWQYFLKPEGFSEEKEYRYLLIDKSRPDGYTHASNGVISGYKDFSLASVEDESEIPFPANLIGIILGPNMKNKEMNRYQLEAMAFEKGIPLIKRVQFSSINYYNS